MNSRTRTGGSPASTDASDFLENDFASLLVPEVNAFLRERGFQVSVVVCEKDSQSLSSASRASLQLVLREYELSRDRERRALEVGQLSACVTHEARNVIGGVVGLAQLSLARLRGTIDAEALPDLSSALETIAQESQRGVEVLSGYLEFSSPRRATVQLVSAATLIEPVVQLTTYKAKQKGCKIRVDIDQALPELVLRASEVREVLLNLVINAIFASPEDGTIQILADNPDPERLRIRVLDNGPGVPDALKAKIFDPFFTTKPPGEGTGLGLALARQVAEGHGGTLTVCDRPGGGAEFELGLPFQQDVWSISGKVPAA